MSDERKALAVPSHHSSLITHHCLFDVRVDGFRVARAVNAAEAIRAPVVVEQGLRLALVDREPRLYRLGVVVGAPFELNLRVEVADVVRLRRLKVDVVNLAADGTLAAARHALLKNFKGHVHEHREERLALPAREALKHLGLRRRAWEAVEHVSVAAVGLRRALLDDLYRQVVRHERARGECGAELLGQRRLGLLHRAEHVARRNLRQAAALLEQTRLRPLARARRTHEDDDFRHKIGFGFWAPRAGKTYNPAPNTRL